MQIERVEIFGVSVPLAGERTIAYQSLSAQKSALVRITATGGVTGLGNVDPVPGYSQETVEETLQALESKFTPQLLGLDPTNINLLLRRLEAISANFLDAKAAVEMACIDISARLLGLPVHAYLGGAVKDRLLLNGWIGIVPPGQAAAEAHGWLQRGFRSTKIKAGDSVGSVYERVAAVRRAVGPGFGIRVDANAGYDAQTAIELARKIAPLDIQLFEQPVPADDLAGMAKVRREGAGIPVMADESVLDHASLIRLIKADAADIVKVKVMKQGGIYSTRRMIDTAEAAGIRCVVGHGFGLGVNTLAEIMVAASSPNVIDGLECVGPLNLSDDVLVQRIDIGSGGIDLPPGPGLGATLDMDKIRRYRLA